MNKRTFALIFSLLLCNSIIANAVAQSDIYHSLNSSSGYSSSGYYNAQPSQFGNDNLQSYNQSDNRNNNTQIYSNDPHQLVVPIVIGVIGRIAVKEILKRTAKSAVKSGAKSRVKSAAKKAAQGATIIVTHGIENAGDLE
jgi:hypothetical protein